MVNHPIGVYPTISLAEARRRAPEVLATLARGERPREVEGARRRDEARRRADRFEEVAEEFAVRLDAGRVRKVRGGGGELRNAREVAAIIRRELIPAWTGQPIGEITRRDVREAIEAILDRDTRRPGARHRSTGGPYAARHALAAARRLFAWAVGRDLIEASPCDGIAAAELHGAPAARSRVLTDDEIPSRLARRRGDPLPVRPAREDAAPHRATSRRNRRSALVGDRPGRRAFRSPGRADEGRHRAYRAADPGGGRGSSQPAALHRRVRVLRPAAIGRSPASLR